MKNFRSFLSVLLLLVLVFSMMSVSFASIQFERMPHHHYLMCETCYMPMEKCICHKCYGCGQSFDDCTCESCDICHGTIPSDTHVGSCSCKRCDDCHSLMTKSITNATCSQTGSIVYTCNSSSCNHSETQILPKTGCTMVYPNDYSCSNPQYCVDCGRTGNYGSHKIDPHSIKIGEPRCLDCGVIFPK